MRIQTDLLLKSLLVLLITAAASARAVDENRLWLPKRYQHLQPQLLETARAAENTYRCQRVIAGEMLPDKSTEQAHYFVITCRDKQRTTYNISYRYPVEGDEPKLVKEQRQPEGTEDAVVPEEGINSEQAVTLCLKHFADAGEELDDAELGDDQDLSAAREGDAFVVRMPFTAGSRLGERVAYRADCRVDADGNTAYQMTLREPGALTLCRERLRSEAILLGRPTLLDEQIEAESTDPGYRFRMPFDIKTMESNAVRYQGDCRVNAAGDTELSIALQPRGAQALCRNALDLETFMLNNVEVEEEPLKLEAVERAYRVDLAFHADGPDGGNRRFLAHCRVDEEGLAVVETELDKTSVIDVCRQKVKQATRDMLAVSLFDKETPPLQREATGYRAMIPFNAEDPSGRQLRYQGECRVDDTGHAQVTIRAREQ